MRQAAVIVLIISLILVSGCIGGQQEAQQRAFLGGTEALSLSFYNLPTQVVQGQYFDIDVIAKNKGEYEIPNNSMSVFLNNAQTFGITSAVQENEYNILSVADGGEAEFIYPNARYLGSVLSQEIPQTVSVGFCYPYQTTVLVREICIAPSLSNNLCEYIGEKETESSGAPIHLTSFKQLSSVYNSGEEYVDIVVDLEFKKKGSGDIYSAKDCTSITAEETNKIIISEMRLGTKVMNTDKISNICGTNIVSLSKKDEGTVGSLRCTITQTGIKTDAKSILTMKLNYLYSHQIKNSIKVIPGSTRLSS